jgi:hypothetical protein
MRRSRQRDWRLIWRTSARSARKPSETLRLVAGFRFEAASIPGEWKTLLEAWTALADSEKCHHAQEAESQVRQKARIISRA